MSSRALMARAAVRPVRQRSQFTCMAASASMALGALGIDVDEDTVNRVMGAKPLHGASWEDALATAQYFGCRATLHAPCTIEQLKAWTDEGLPVLIGWNPEGRPWSHASLVFDVDEDYVHVADPNCPNPDQTVRSVPIQEFLEKWKEDRGDFLVRRPAMKFQREIDPAGVPINKVDRANPDYPAGVSPRVMTAGKKERNSIKDRAMSRFLKHGPVIKDDSNETLPEMAGARRQMLLEQGLAGLPGAGMGAGFHKDKSRYDRKRDRSFEREAARYAASDGVRPEDVTGAPVGTLVVLYLENGDRWTAWRRVGPKKTDWRSQVPSSSSPDKWEDSSNPRLLEPYAFVAMMKAISREGSKMRIIPARGASARYAKNLPADVERYVQGGKDQGLPEDEAWAVAWSRYCKYKNPGSDHCQMDPGDYFPGRKAAETTMSNNYWDGYNKTAGKGIDPQKEARFTEGPEGQREFQDWKEKQPEEFQQEWDQNTEEYGDKFKTAAARGAMSIALASFNKVRRAASAGRLPPATLYKLARALKSAAEECEAEEDKEAADFLGS